MTAPVESAPPLPDTLEATYDIQPSLMRVVYRARKWDGIVFFLLIWIAVWTVCCIGLVVSLLRDPQWMSLLFGIPFWLAWLLVAGILGARFFRRQTLEVDDQQVRFTDEVWIQWRNRAIPREELRGVTVFRRTVNEDVSQPRYRWGLRIASLGKPLELFLGMSEAELRWLAYRLNQLVDPALRTRTPAADELPTNPPGIGLKMRTTVARPLALAGAAIAAPSECSWQLTPEFAGIEITQRGRWSWANVGATFVFALFWNCIVGVFVAVQWGGMPNGPQRGFEWWFLCLFLIPFELIGIGLVCGTVLTMLEPIRRTIWRFEDNEIFRRRAWLGIGIARRYRVSRLARIDLLETRATQEPAVIINMAPPFGLAFVQPNEKALCTIRALNEGEARWIGDAVLRARPHWFDQAPTAD